MSEYKNYTVSITGEKVPKDNILSSLEAVVKFCIERVAEGLAMMWDEIFMHFDSTAFSWCSFTL